MTLEQLRYFLEVAKWESFSQAAEALHISQPAVSKQISNLEKYLRVTLFKRTNKGIELTEKGKEFYRKVRPLIQQLDFIASETMSIKQLRVGSLATIGSLYFPMLAAKFAAEHFFPTIKSTTRELIELAVNGELDVIIVQDIENVDDFYSKFIFEEAYMAAIPGHHPLAKQEEVKLSDFKYEKILLPPLGCDSRRAVLEGFNKANFQLKVYLDVPYDSLLSYTAAEHGISFVPSVQAQNVTQKGVVFKSIKRAPIRRKIYMFARSQDLLNLVSGLLVI